MPTSTPSQDDYFFQAYDREDVAYGLAPSPALRSYLQQIYPDGIERGSRVALDIGAGAGRDTLALAQVGFRVVSVDLSERGLRRIEERSKRHGVDDLVRTQASDVREFDFEEQQYDAIIATTVLDHIPEADSIAVWKQLCRSLTPDGLMYVQVHTTEDPGCGIAPGCNRESPISETAEAVINYFPPNRLVRWASQAQSQLRVLRYEERLEWDTTHGEPHLHGKAVLLAVKEDHHPNWYGQPPAFPRPG
ncbi:MAG: class I SAM-dependent methyltransferase [Planctomycetota bacterium]